MFFYTGYILPKVTVTTPRLHTTWAFHHSPQHLVTTQRYYLNFIIYVYYTIFTVISISIGHKLFDFVIVLYNENWNLFFMSIIKKNVPYQVLNMNVYYFIK